MKNSWSNLHNVVPVEKGSKGKGKGKDKGKDKDKKKKKGGNSNLAAQTPDGREICYSWWQNGKCDGRCGRVHTCRKCPESHTRADCKLMK